MIININESAINKILKSFPQRISYAISALNVIDFNKICEIRIHNSGIMSLTIDGKSKILELNNKAVRISAEEITEFIYKICSGSVYTKEESFKNFYITVNGIRIGFSGEAIIENGKYAGISEIHGLNIRIPRHIDGCANEIIDYIKMKQFPDGKGILIISKPGMGKTTLIRDLILQLTDATKQISPRRITVIDERKEIYMNNIFENCTVDFLSGVDKIFGIETAVRVLSPEIIVCDEISGPEEALEITKRKNNGTIFIASVHSDNFETAIKKDYISKMFTDGVFGCGYTIYKKENKINGYLTEFDTAND